MNLEEDANNNILPIINNNDTENESHNFYISSRGFMKICDYYSSTPISGVKQVIDYPTISSLSKPVLYICSSAIPHFIKNMLKKIDFQFILVSGDCNNTCPMNVFSTRYQYIQFMEDPRIIHWFVQNFTETHEKITNIPIGLDYHTMKIDTKMGDITSCYDQENILNQIISIAKPFHERIQKCYGNFQFAMNTRFAYDRYDARFNIDNKLVFYEPCQISRIETWKKQTEYSFVISPHGEGYDCHRTWEALILGCIPIVKQSKIDMLYENLPVLIVERWSDVTDELLKVTITQFQQKTFQYQKLSLEYWKQKIYSFKKNEK